MCVPVSAEGWANNKFGLLSSKPVIPIKTGRKLL
jgi:hypothetical protein